MCFLGPLGARGRPGLSVTVVMTYANMLAQYSLLQRSNFRNISGVICRLRAFAAATNASCETYKSLGLKSKRHGGRRCSHKCCIDIFSHGNQCGLLAHSRDFCPRAPARLCQPIQPSEIVKWRFKFCGREGEENVQEWQEHQDRGQVRPPCCEYGCGEYPRDRRNLAVLRIKCDRAFQGA
jgi:hypothetical protein